MKSFQRDNGLLDDGVVGIDTWSLLLQDSVPTELFGPNPGGPKPTIRYGDSGPYVEDLQRELKQLMFYTGEIHGRFGDKTLAAVKAFQTVNRLPADGVVGRATWHALYSLYPPPVEC